MIIDFPRARGKWNAHTTLGSERLFITRHKGITNEREKRGRNAKNERYGE